LTLLCAFIQNEVSILLAYNTALHARRMKTSDHTATNAESPLLRLFSSIHRTYYVL